MGQTARAVIDVPVSIDAGGLATVVGAPQTVAVLQALRDVARFEGRVATDAWVQQELRELLSFFQQCVSEVPTEANLAGVVQELCLPTGVTLRLGYPRVLAMLARAKPVTLH